MTSSAPHHPDAASANEPDASVSQAVPDRSHYVGGYAGRWRIHSYAHQIETALALQPRKVLEVGVGAGLVAAALRAVGVQVATLDVEHSLEPDLFGSVKDIPAEDKSFDVALCCQVLEHLPFEQFAAALGELRRVTRTGMVLSLPDCTRCYYVRAQLPLLRQRRIALNVPRIRPAMITEEYFQSTGHFWEVGIAGFPLKLVQQRLIESGWRIERTWRVPEMTWHRFFDLRVAT